MYPVLRTDELKDTVAEVWSPVKVTSVGGQGTEGENSNRSSQWIFRVILKCCMFFDREGLLYLVCLDVFFKHWLDKDTDMISFFWNQSALDYLNFFLTKVNLWSGTCDTSNSLRWSAGPSWVLCKDCHIVRGATGHREFKVVAVCPIGWHIHIGLWVVLDMAGHLHQVCDVRTVHRIPGDPN